MYTVSCWKPTGITRHLHPNEPVSAPPITGPMEGPIYNVSSNQDNSSKLFGIPNSTPTIGPRA